MKKAKTSIKTRKMKFYENIDNNNKDFDEDSAIMTLNLFNTEKKVSKKEREENKELNKKNEFLENIYKSCIEVLQSNINKIEKLINIISLPKLTKLEDILQVIEYFIAQLELRTIKIRFYFRIKKEIYYLLNKYLIDFIINENTEKNFEKNFNDLEKIYLDLNFFIAFCEEIYNDYFDYFCQIISGFSIIMKKIFSTSFKHVAIFIRFLILPYINEYKEILQKKSDENKLNELKKIINYGNN